MPLPEKSSLRKQVFKGKLLNPRLGMLNVEVPSREPKRDSGWVLDTVVGLLPAHVQVKELNFRKIENVQQNISA